ncbi:cation-translocating P-type ATPase [Mycetocola zhujimingii]|uniref:Carbonate dehydratase n=1 Tax=Mycetocola zhujimingii TaxID=2079792 RepID=A0A2U1TC45_9MICO|nr:HAD-IC family P-type ATPase [Mycetocola zhujimingii]PWC06458.1 carbonate dehydratase [Mycetocola zhujimingii]
MTLDTPTSAPAPAAHAQESDAVLAQLGSTPNGLSTADAAARLNQYGPNRLAEGKPRPALLRLLGHFRNILIYILLGAAVIKAVYRDWLDFWVIATVAVVTALIGFIQEGQAERALAGIRNLLSLSAHVRRDGSWIEVAADTLVPGDIVRIRAGDKIPADLRLISANQLEVDESALTGESVAAAKSTDSSPHDAGVGDREGMAFSGTAVTGGAGVGVVTATGPNTEIGHIQSLISEAQPLATPLTLQLDALSKRMALVIFVAAAVMTVAGRLLHDDSPRDLLTAAITFAVAAVPEGLPAIVTITLALGVQQMAKEQAITRKLTAVETLGSVTTICSDKTGTLTLNEMTVRDIITPAERFGVTGEGYRPVGEVHRASDGSVASLSDFSLAALVATVARCNDAALAQDGDEWSIVGAPTEGSLVVLARKLGFNPEGHTRLAELPFDSATKFMAVLDRDPAGVIRLMVKGAPDRLLERCTTELAPDGSTQPLDSARWHAAVDELGATGLRVLAAAWTRRDTLSDVAVESVRDLTFLGLVGIADPPRPEAIEAVRLCHSAGIRVAMITGDHAATAAAISSELGLADDDATRVVTGAELQRMSDSELSAIAPEVTVFARTSPEHKIRIVRALQSRGQVVAMTGDGVNDAPALRRADIGIAMGINGTEVTKEAADIVLADDDFATIERAVAEGRRIFDNIQKSLMFLLPTTFAQALVVLTAVLGGFVPPLQPTQVLWVNLVTGVTLSIALAYEREEPGVMNRPPRDRSTPVIDRILLPRIILVSVLITAATIGIFFFVLNTGSSFAVAQTSAVTMLVLGQATYLFNCRFLRSTSVTPRVLVGNRVVWYSIGILFAIQLTFIYAPFMQAWFDTVPLGPREWGIALGFGVAIFLIVEVEKAIVGGVERRRSA